MRRSSNGKLWLAIALLLLLAACSPPTNTEPLADNEPSAPASDGRTPEQIMSAFMQGWDSRDIATMYSQIATRSQELYSAQDFENNYDVVNGSINVQGIQYSIRDVHLQGNTAAITYDLSIESPIFGEINDPGRVIRLIQNNGSWRVAWSPMDIFDGLSSNAELRVNTRFPQRGNIVDRNGKVLVEESGANVILYGAQQDMRGVDACIDLLSDIMRRQRAELVRLFGDFVPETIFHIGEIDPETFFDNRSELEIVCGIYDSDEAINRVSQQTARRYFGHGAAAHITGYTGVVPADQLELWSSRGYDTTDIVGLAGIEFSYEAELAGRPERFLRITETGGGTIIRELGGALGSPSHNVTLTVDRDLQLVVSQALSDAFNYARNNWAGVSLGSAAVILDVNTGEVLALASYPTFDPGIFRSETSYNTLEVLTRIGDDPRLPLRNKVIQDQYSPGSVYKIITTTAVGAEGIFSPDDIFNCELEWEGGARFGDVLPVRYDWRYTDGFDAAGEITMAEALTASCDPFYYEMGALLFQREPNLLVEYSQLLGLGRPTGLSVLGREAIGNLAAPSTVGEAINNAIGQGSVSISPMQMAVAVATVANGGTVYQPYIVQQVSDLSGETTTFEGEPVVVRELDIDDAVLETVRQGMCAVTTNEDLGTASFVFENTPYTVCGKTGTAQTAAFPQAWFVAYAPADDPQIAIVVMTANSREGSEVAAPIVRRILDNYFDAPREPFPEWWENEYIPLPVPAEGGTVGG